MMKMLTVQRNLHFHYQMELVRIMSTIRKYGQKLNIMVYGNVVLNSFALHLFHT